VIPETDLIRYKNESISFVRRCESSDVIFMHCLLPAPLQDIFAFECRVDILNDLRFLTSTCSRNLVRGISRSTSPSMLGGVI